MSSSDGRYSSACSSSLDAIVFNTFLDEQPPFGADLGSAMPDERVLVIVVKHVPDAQGGEVGGRQHVGLAVERAAVRHEGACHGTAPPGGHVRSRSVEH